MATTTLFDQVLSALSSNDEVRLEQIFNDLSLRIDSLHKLKAGEHFSQIGKSLYRDICAETTYLPKHLKDQRDLSFVALR